MTKTTRRRYGWWRQATALVASLFAALASTIAAGSGARADGEPTPDVPMSFVKTFTVHDDTGGRVTTPAMYVDGPNRKIIFVSYTRKLYVVDADSFAQGPSLDLGIETSTPYLALDPAHKRLFALHQPFGSTASGPAVPMISTVPLDGSAATVAELPTDANGEFPAGIAYFPGDDRVYVIDQGAQALEHVGSAPIIRAFDAAKLASTDPTVRAAAQVWSYRVTGCPAVPALATGAFLGRSPAGFLYFFCVGTPDNTSSAFAVRVGMGSGNATDSSGFTLETFPIAADLSNGFAAGDPAGDRLIVASTPAGQQKLYVFDALHGAWTGSVPLGAANVRGAISEAATGRTYMQQDYDGLGNLLVTEDRLAPLDQGKNVTLRNGSGVAPQNAAFAPPAFDPVTRRLLEFEFRDDSFDPVNVFQDNVPAAPLPLPADPDADTHQIDEQPGLPVSFTVGASSFGARVTVVGGTRSALPLGTDPSAITGIPPDLKPTTGDRSVFLGQVKGAQVNTNSATARAAAGAVDEATDSDLSSKAPPLHDAVLGTNDGDHQDGQIGEFKPSACKDFGDGSAKGSNAGSDTSCDLANFDVKAAADAGDEWAQLPVKVGTSSSLVHLRRVSADGAVAEATAITRGIDIPVPGAGEIAIGEIKNVAQTQAHGRVGTATSTFRASVNGVRVTDATGKDLFACGWATTEQGPESNPCGELSSVAHQISTLFPGRVEARGPQADRSADVAGSPKGAQAEVVKDPAAYANDFSVNHDQHKEVSALTLTVYNDQRDSSRVVVDLAAVEAESHYAIGAAPVVPPADPATLRILLLDDAKVPQPLDGGHFDLFADKDGDGKVGLAESAQVPLSCVTEAGKPGNCEFKDLEAGKYVIQEKIAPDGYVAGPDYPLTLDSGTAYTATFTNLKAIGQVGILLGDDSNPPNPLSGGTFDVLVHVPSLGVAIPDKKFSCTTNEQGFCGFGDMPLADFVVHEAQAPPGYDPADDAAFSLSKAGQAALVVFINGKTAVPGAPATPAVPPTPPTPGSPPVPPHVVHHPGQPAAKPKVTLTITKPPAPKVTSHPTHASSGPVYRQAAQLPAEAVRFLVRKPGQGLLFAALWLLLGAPAYLLARRRTLIVSKEAV